MECTRCELCAAAGEVFIPYSFSYFALLFRIVIGPLLIVLNSLLAAAVFRSKSLPSNAKLLLFFFCISMIVSNIGNFAGALINLVVSFVLPEDRRCEYQVFSPYLHQAAIIAILTMFDIFATFLWFKEFYHILTEIGFLWMIFSLFSLCIERSISVLFESKYPRRLLSPLLCIAQVFIILALLFFVDAAPVQILPYQAFELRNTAKHQGLLDISIVLSVCEILLFFCIFNVRQQRKVPRSNSTVCPNHTSSIDRMLLHISVYSFCTVLVMELIFRSWMPSTGPQTVITSELLAEVVSYSPFGEVRKCIMPIAIMLSSIAVLTNSEEMRRLFLGLLQMRPHESCSHSSQWRPKETSDESTEP